MPCRLECSVKRIDSPEGLRCVEVAEGRRLCVARCGDLLALAREKPALLDGFVGDSRFVLVSLCEDELGVNVYLLRDLVKAMPPEGGRSRFIVSAPLRDFSVEPRESAEAALCIAARELASSSSVVVVFCCCGGVGRSGTLAAATLARVCGLGGDEATRLTRELLGAEPEVDEQRRFVDAAGSVECC